VARGETVVGDAIQTSVGGGTAYHVLRNYKKLLKLISKEK
jgi:hypothetical protein